MNEYLFSQIILGQKESFQVLVTEDMENSFRIITGDNNPLHRDDSFAVAMGPFKSHVVFGMLTASFYSTFAGMHLPGKYSLIHSFDKLSFLKPVFIGDLLTITGEVIDKIDSLKLICLNIEIKNQNNKIVSKAKMKVLVLK